MKLELKHLTGYLPYGLKLVNITYKPYLIFDVKKHHFNTDFSTNLFEFQKPILRPLSDLTKEIEVNGEKFVPVNEILRIFGKSLKYLSTDYQVKDLKKFEEEVITKQLPYSYIQKLLEWHFDIYGLIENGLAIDINTLNK